MTLCTIATIKVKAGHGDAVCAILQFHRTGSEIYRCVAIMVADALRRR